MSPHAKVVDGLDLVVVYGDRIVIGSVSISVVGTDVTDVIDVVWYSLMGTAVVEVWISV